MSILLTMVAFVFMIVAFSRFFRLWKRTKPLKVGSTITTEYVDLGLKDIKFGIIFLSAGCIIELIAILI